MEGGYDEPAIAHFTQALKMDADAWLPKEGLARVYGGQGLYLDAIDLMQDACNCIPPGFEHLGGYLLPWIAIWKRETGDFHGAYHAAREGNLADPSSLLAQYIFLGALYQEGHSKDIVQMLKYLAGCWSIEKSMSWLTRLLMQNPHYPVFDYLGGACRHVTKPAFILEELDRLLDVVSKGRDEYSKVVLHGQVALFKYEYDDQDESPMKLFEQALKLDSTSNTLSIYQRNGEKKVFEHMLAQLYFDTAVKAKKSGVNPSPFARKLRKMATATNSNSMTDNSDDTFEFWGAGYASMLWGQWRRDYESADASTWRKCFRARVLEELKLLDDDDPTNDMQGLHTLAITLLHADDRVNAAAILAVLFKPVQDERLASFETEDKANQAHVVDKTGTGESKLEREYSEHPGGQKSTSHDDRMGQEKTRRYDQKSKQDVTVPYFAKLARCVALPDEGGIQDPENRPKLPEYSTVAQPTELNTHESQSSKPIRAKLQKPKGSNTPESALLPALNNTSITTSGRLALNLSAAWIHECDGPCDTSYRDYKELYVCKICFGKKFCGKCLENVKAGTLVRRTCCPNHDWYQAWPIAEPRWREVAEEEVDGKLMIPSRISSRQEQTIYLHIRVLNRNLRCCCIPATMGVFTSK